MINVIVIYIFFWSSINVGIQYNGKTLNTSLKIIEETHVIIVAQQKKGAGNTYCFHPQLNCFI